jgi:hypothetical protein
MTRSFDSGTPHPRSLPAEVRHDVTTMSARSVAAGSAAIIRWFAAEESPSEPWNQVNATLFDLSHRSFSLNRHSAREP